MDEQIEQIARAIAKVIADRHGHQLEDWLNDERRAEARGAHSVMAGTIAELTDEQIIEIADECFPCAPDAWRTDYAFGDKPTVISFARRVLRAALAPHRHD